MPTTLSTRMALWVVMAFAAAALSSCSQSRVEKRLPPVVSTQKVEVQTLERDDEYSAVVAASRQLDVSFKAGGYVESILKVRGIDGALRNVQEGDYVRRGTVLARLRAGEYKTRVRLQAAAADEVRLSDGRARAALSEAQISLDQARSDFERAARLYNANSMTRPEYEGASSRMSIAEARQREAAAALAVNRATADRAGAGLSEAHLALADCTLIAPLDGVILKRTIEEGSLAAAGAPAFTMADASSVKISFAVPDVKLADLRLGQELSVTTEAFAGSVFRGHITAIAPAADARSRSFNVEVTIPNKGGRLRPGMVMALTVAEGKPPGPVLAVPLTAVVRSSTNADGYSVFVTGSGSGGFIVRERPVKLGEAFGQVIAVIDGVRAGESVVVSGAGRVVDGQEVRIVDEPGPPTYAPRADQKGGAGP